MIGGQVEKKDQNLIDHGVMDMIRELDTHTVADVEERHIQQNT